MSGIAGIYYLDGRLAEQENLGRMVDSLTHRGPDGAEVWCSESVGLGHRMLWTTPESLLEKQPLVDQTGSFILTADARIDNRDELICTLRLSDYRAEKITDSQLILAAYKKWGEQCPEKLIGDFALAIWDGRKQQIFCARDPMGIKPFYYYYSQGIFVFASEIKALFCLPEVPRRLNELMVACYLEMFFEGQEITFYQDIFRLPAAHSLTVGRTQAIQLQSYWSLDPKREIRFNSQQEYTEAFREIFTEAVRCRLRSAFPVGSTLSGGLDSSSITCMARQLLAESGNQQLHTFSAIFPSVAREYLPQIDERKYMSAVKALGGLHAHDVRADQLNPLADLLWQEEEPICAFNLYIHQGLYNCAHQHGVRVVLDGIDGDSTVSHGWRYLTELTFKGRWQTLWQEVNAVSRRFHVGRKQVLGKYCLNPLLVDPPTFIWQWLGKKIHGSKPRKDLINWAFGQQVGLPEYIQAVMRTKPALPLTSRQDHWISLTTGLYPYVMEVTDKAAAKYSLEGRYPFFDRRLMEFCLALPSEQKFSQGLPRYILRAAMDKVLPSEIQWRVSKGNLSHSFNQQLLKSQRAVLEEVLSQPQAIESYLKVSNLQAAYRRYSDQPNRSGEEAMTVLAGVTLSLWLQKANLIP